MKHLRNRLTYANVMSTIAVFLVLGGGAAVAANQLGKNTVGPKQLKKNAVTAVKIKNNAVTNAKIGDGAVTNAKIGDGAVTNAKIGDGAVTGGKIADGSVTTHKIAGGAVTTERIAEGAVTGGKIANGSITSDKLATSYLPASTPGLPAAGASVSKSGGVNKWFNRFGGKPVVQFESPGIYVVTFPGLEGQAFYDNSIGLVSLNDSDPGEIIRGSNNGNPRIVTFNSAGSPANRGFDLVLFVPETE